ncbi:MAG: ferredoxin:thioredoxin reductase [Spirochaetales bacterium]|nr:MAG: ferredoxin:thioredoxin reductase [Spirochaetales bacterium]
MPLKKTTETTRNFVEAVAKHQGWKLNSDREFLDSIITGLTATYNNYGYFRCPCRDSWGTREKDADIVCPCEYCRPDMQEYGHCYCGLFLTADFAAGGKPPSSIPERRPENRFP